MAYTPRLKCHIHNKLTGLRRVYVGIAPAAKILMRLGCLGKGTEDFSTP